jgi:hypothetical protein
MEGLAVTARLARDLFAFGTLRMTNVLDDYLKTVPLKILRVLSRHRRIKILAPPFLFCDEDKPRDRLLVSSIPDDDLDDVFVELAGRILPRYLELVGGVCFGIEDIEPLVEIWSYKRFDLIPVWVELMHRRSPSFRNCLSVPRVIGNIAAFAQALSKGGLSGEDDWVVHE